MAADLLDRNVRDLCQIAYHPGLDDIAVHEHVVLAAPHTVQWLTVTAAWVAGAGVAYTTRGPDGVRREHRDYPDWPIVLRG